MIKWPVKYTDFDGNDVEEEIYFNLSAAEVMEIQLQHNGSYANYLRKILMDRDGAKLAETYKSLLIKAYGEKSPDGRRFYKSDDRTKEFLASGAYSSIYVQLLTDTSAAEKFLIGVFPKEYTSQMKTNKPLSEMSSKEMLSLMDTAQTTE